jgi:hypothetical protein
MLVAKLSEAYSTLPTKYAESLLYIDLVDILTAYRRTSRLSTIGNIVGVRDTSLSKYVNGRLRPRSSKSLAMIKVLTDMNLVKRVVSEYLRDGSLVELLTDVPFTKLIALSILGRLVKIFHGSRVETVVAPSEALLIASHISHRLKSTLINLHTIRSSSKIRNLGNTVVILVLTDDEIVEQMAKVRAEGRKTAVRYVFSVIYSKEVDTLASIFPYATVEYLIGTLP